MLRHALVLLLMLLCLGSCESREQRLMDEGDLLVERIEIFNKENGRLPESLTEMGIEEKMEGPLYYQKEGEDQFIVSFGLTLGESMIYRSETGEWRDY